MPLSDKYRGMAERMTAAMQRAQEREVAKHNEIVEECAKLAGEVSERAMLAVLAFKLSDE